MDLQFVPVPMNQLFVWTFVAELIAELGILLATSYNIVYTYNIVYSVFGT